MTGKRRKVVKISRPRILEKVSARFIEVGTNYTFVAQSLGNGSRASHLIHVSCTLSSLREAVAVLSTDIFVVRGSHGGSATGSIER